MPEISRFYDDHNPPHFHVKYGSFNATILIGDFRVAEGKLPPKALGLVMEWAAKHQDELTDAWELAKHNQIPNSIEPLE